MSLGGESDPPGSAARSRGRLSEVWRRLIGGRVPAVAAVLVGLVAFAGGVVATKAFEGTRTTAATP